MRRYVAGVMVLGLLAGCTADWDSSRTSAKGLALRAARPDAVDSQMRGSASLATRAGVRGARDFASLPDRGELLAYVMPRDRRLAQNPEAAFQVRLSEEHAFNAAHKGGRIVVPTPDGGSATLTYERHVEHDDGNWSWIGRDENGADAVLTFGEKAVFGTIPQGGESWRLTSTAGQSWLSKVDRNRIAAMGSGKRAATDALVPPPNAVGDASQTESPGAHSNITMVASDGALAATTVDVLVGYTNGLASDLGQSQVLTRINYLIDVTNQAYANSGVNAQVRLVGTQQVNYIDDNDNGKALEELSGQTQTGPTAPHPAFAALRAARDTLGADLVVLLRDFRAPQNNGCGIAWLIGSGQTGIEQADAPFGYSVVSDGDDVDESDGRGYFCRDESVAHEMGHNMGQAHNVDNSSSSGVHAYSYGYRENSSTGFYTVMAYALSGGNQTSIRYFANPQVTYDGRPTGTANADNVRSMNQVIPVVATFRGAVRQLRPRNDVTGDGKSDLIWYQPDAQQVAFWVMNGGSIAWHGGQASGGGYQVISVGDYDGNAGADLLWRGPGGDLRLWLSTGVGFVQQAFVAYPIGWNLIGSYDVNADGKSDLIWYEPVAQQVAFWVMNGSSIAWHGGQASSGNYQVIAVGDYDGNTGADLLWRGPGGDLRLWLSTGVGFVQQAFVGYPTGWNLIGSDDVNGDGKSDLIWYQPGAQQVAFWVMNGSSIAWHGGQASSGNYQAIAVGDYDGNAGADLLWRGPGGDLRLWLSTGVGFVQQGFVNYPTGWTLVSKPL